MNDATVRIGQEIRRFFKNEKNDTKERRIERKTVKAEQANEINAEKK